MSKHKDLQPWLGYFEMLQQYEQKGYLEIMPDKHEAYITQPALFALCPNCNDADDISAQGTPVSDTVRRLRAYAAYLSRQSGMGYYDKPFALHVVKDAMPHDLLYTLLLTRKRVWWKLWRKADRIEVIAY